MITISTKLLINMNKLSIIILQSEFLITIDQCRIFDRTGIIKIPLYIFVYALCMVTETDFNKFIPITVLKLKLNYLIKPRMQWRIQEAV